MKILIHFLIITSFISCVATAADEKAHSDRYCAKIVDGMKVVMHMGSPISADVTLANGIKIKVDGTIVKTNGTKIILETGECIDEDGFITRENEKNN